MNRSSTFPRDQVSDDQPIETQHHVATYPDVMTPDDMQHAWRIKHSKFFALAKRGYFDRFEILPRVGVRRWSGVLVAEFLKSAGRSAFVFGRKRA